MDFKNILTAIILIIVIVGGIYFKITLTDAGFAELVLIMLSLIFVNWGGLSAYEKFNNNPYSITLKGVFAYVGGAVLAAIGLFFILIIIG